MDKTYDPKSFEQRINKRWLENGYFAPKPGKKKKKFSIVLPPPNITGQLHVGHAMNVTIPEHQFVIQGDSVQNFVFAAQKQIRTVFAKP